MHNLENQLTVAMITMNESSSVAKVIKDIKAIVPQAEILIVDSSKDDTPLIAEKCGARVIRQFPPRGYGPAMECALRSAKGDIVVTMDCDNTYPASQIPVFASLISDQGYDLVDGSRLRKKPYTMPWLNYVANVFFAGIASLLFFRRFTDLHSGMRAYRKSMLNQLTFQAKGAALPVELLLKPTRLGFKVGTVFIDYHERIGVSTMQPLTSAWWTLKRIIKVRLFA